MPKGRLVFDGDNIYTEKDARIYKLKTGVSSKIDAIPWVVDSLDSTSATDALSANMGRQLQDQINSLSWTWKFLSTWDCVTWLPGTNPQEDPYTYNVWDYYVVSTVWTTNYKPHWGTYTQWVPSTTVETESVWANDKYYFDWADWVRIPDTAIQIWIDSSLSTTSTNAVENRAIANAINTKQDIITDLVTIRSWAAAGSTALQRLDNITELTNNAGYQTAGDVTSIVNNIISTVAPDWVWTWILTVQKNATTVDTFSANATQNKTINITVPTTVAELTDANDYATKADVAADLSDYVQTSDLWAAALSNDYNDLNNKPTIPTVNNATLTIQKNSANVATFTANSNTNTTANISVPTTVAELSDASNYATKTYADNAAAGVVHAWATAPSPATEWMLWYDTTNDVLKTYDWTNWNATGKEYTAWEWIAILNWVDDYSAIKWPCPDGFHIPFKSERQTIVTAMNRFGLSNLNWRSTYLHIPLSWCLSRSDWSLTNVGSTSYLWSCQWNEAWAYNGTAMLLDSNLTVWYGAKALGCSIRPFKDTPVAPDSTWTQIYYPDVAVWSEWIYLNSSLWLITIVYRENAQTKYITMADKNLWATTMWSSWDALSEANCWKFYQRWNNYWFSRSWPATTSATQVNASTYWPWNYYSSGTFITWNDSWDSSNNANLWWWTTWITQLNNAITNTRENIFVTQAQYDALPSSKTSDWNTYFIYSAS